MSKKILLNQTAWIVRFLVVSFSCSAQTFPDELTSQNPLDKLVTSFYPVIKAPVKSFRYILDKDTISTSYYDKYGNEITKFEEYRKGKPQYKITNTYAGNKKSLTSFFVNDILQSTTSYTYDKKGNIIEWKSIKTIYDKQNQSFAKVLDVDWIIEYTSANTIKSKYLLNTAKEKTQTFDYLYNAAGKLIEVNEMQWKTTYEYKDGLLARRYRTFKSDNSTIASYDYEYNKNGLVVKASDPTALFDYTYEDKILKQIAYKKKIGNSAQNIYFQYNDKLLSAVEILSNDISLTYAIPAFVFKSDYIVSFWGRNEINKLKMEFLYDSHHNIVQIKYFVGGHYAYSKRFMYEYY